MTDEQWVYLQKLLDPIDISKEEYLNISKKHDGKMGTFYHHVNSPEIAHQVIHANQEFLRRYAPWVMDEQFKFIYHLIKDYSLLDLYRLYDLYSLAIQSSKISGCILEVGVANGGSGALLSFVAKEQNKTCYLADTWKGVVKASDKDTNFVGGEFEYAETEVVNHLLSSLNTTANTQLLVGIFPDDTAKNIKDRISFIHIDVDTYISCKDTIEWAISKLSIGAIIVFDDYGFLGLEGVTRYVNEFSKDARFIYNYNLNGHATFVKIKE
jgi:O-methyltransferase